VFDGPKEKQDHGVARDSGVRAWVIAEVAESGSLSVRLFAASKHRGVARLRSIAMDIADARAIRTIALEKCDRLAGRDLDDRMRGEAQAGLDRLRRAERSSAVGRC
jgi:hypothetical protein